MNDLEQRLERIETLLLKVINVVGHEAYMNEDEKMFSHFLPEYTLEKRVKMIEDELWSYLDDIQEPDY